MIAAALAPPALAPPALAPKLTGARTLRVGAAVASAAAVDVAVDPVHTHVPLCPLHSMTGLSCPLCGGLRTIAELAHGQLVAAAHANLLIVLAIPLVVAWWARGGLPGANTRSLSVPGWFRPAVVAVAVVFAVLRNLPSFAALRPA